MFAGNIRSMTPQSRFPTILITRPEPQASRFAKDLIATFGPTVSTLVSPLMRPEVLVPALPQMPFASVVFTSESGVRAARELKLTLPDMAFCVGDQTAKVAAQAGFTALSAKGDADDLFDLLMIHADFQPFLLLQGKETRGNLLERLRARGVNAAQAVIYEQREQPLNAAAVNALTNKGDVILPVFSPRTAELLVAAMGHINVVAKTRFVAISPACAEKLGPFAERAGVSATPDRDGMMDALKAVVSCT